MYTIDKINIKIKLTISTITHGFLNENPLGLFESTEYCSFFVKKFVTFGNCQDVGVMVESIF